MQKNQDCTIRQVIAREVLDSRGKPTLEAEVWLASGVWGRAQVPSGASTGQFEACELRDNDRQRYDGQGVLQAVTHVREIIAAEIRGQDARNQQLIDQRLLQLDGTPNKERLGANALLGVSLAVARAAASANSLPLYKYLHELLVIQQGDSLFPEPRMPLPMTNMISGGLHAGGNLDFQDVMIIPCGADNYRQGLEWIVRVYRRLGERLQSAGYEGRLVGDEGGYGPRLSSNVEAVEFVLQAIEDAGLQPGADISIALDVAATHFLQEDGYYQLRSENSLRLESGQMIDLLEHWVDRFPIVSIEDGLSEDDWEGWRELTRRLGERVQLVGDDLFTTQAARVTRGIQEKAANSVLVKVNQIGTLTEAFETMQRARAAGFSLVVSARSGETEDDLLADLAVAAAAEQIKIGSIVRSERLAKYNQLLRISESLEKPGD
ncbi:MAG TPA: phosphopyruvate hydratase [Planctomycetes bacterium]|nr:phosphopyruvate hydratase [Planctomycetota bacterium]